MKVYISSDIEGCVGVTTWCETENGQEDYESACRQMTLQDGNDWADHAALYEYGFCREDGVETAYFPGNKREL